MRLRNAHSGATVVENRHFVASLDELKRIVSKQFAIALQQVFIVLPSGSKLKHLEQLDDGVDELFVFDRRYFTIEADVPAEGDKYKPEANHQFVEPTQSPLMDIDLRMIDGRQDANGDKVRQLIGLLTTNLGWCAAIQSDSNLINKSTLNLAAKIDILLRSFKVASLYFEKYCTHMDGSFRSSLDSFHGLKTHSLVDNWEFQYSEVLKRIPQITNESLTLADLLSYDELTQNSESSVSTIATLDDLFQATEQFSISSTDLRKAVSAQFRSLEIDTTHQLSVSAELSQDLDQLNALSSKVQFEIKDLLSLNLNSHLNSNETNITTILDCLKLHKSSYTTTIYKSSKKLYDYYFTLENLYTNLQKHISVYLKSLSKSQYEMVQLKDSLKAINLSIIKLQNHEAFLAQTIDLPVLYGLFIIEQIRRSDWLAKMKSIASITNENFAQLRDREIKTRSKWISDFGIILELFKTANNDDTTNGFNIDKFIEYENIEYFDINITNTGDSSDSTVQQFDKKHFKKYLDILKKLNINSEIISILEKNFNELSAKMAKVKLFENDNSIDLIKGYKSRIKNLENLLYNEQVKNSSFNSTPNSNNVGNGWPSTLLTDLSRSPSPTQLSKSKQENIQLSNELSKYKSSIEILKNEIHLKEEEFKKQLKSFENIKDENRNEINKLNLKISNNFKYKFELEELTILQKNEIKLKNGEILKLSEQIDDLNKDLGKNSLELNKKERSLRDLTDELVNLKDEFGKNMSLIESKNKEITLINEKYREISQKLEASNEEIKRLNGELKEFKALEEDIKKLKAENAKLLESKDLEIKELKQELKSMEQVKLENEKLPILTDKINELNLEIEDLKEKNSIKQENLLLKRQDSEINELSQQVEQLKLDNFEIKKSKEFFKDKNSELNSKLKENEAEITALKEELENSKEEAQNSLELKKLNIENEKELIKLRTDYNFIKLMKEDLLENMSNRENEFANEKEMTQKEIESLKVRIESFEKSSGELNEVNVKLASMVANLILALNSVLIKVCKMNKLLFKNYEMFCVTLKSIGLLPIKLQSNSNPAEQVSIIRVKGLKKLPPGNKLELNNKEEFANSEIVTDIENDVIGTMNWVDLIDSELVLSVKDDSCFQNFQHIEMIYNKVLEAMDFDNIEVRFDKFVEQVTNLDEQYAASVGKRFKEVENLAKRTIKDNKKLKSSEILSFSGSASATGSATAGDTGDKISIKDFKVGDLVLFLPTKFSKKGNTWAVFNVGDAKLLLKGANSSTAGKEWLTGRLTAIEPAGSPSGKEFWVEADLVSD